jgi:hypothetical protein
MEQLQNGHFLLVEGLMVGAWDRYSSVVATYFVGTQQDHYVLKSGYLIAQANKKAEVEKLKTLTEILMFHQGNKFALSSLVSMMLVVEKEPMDWATWFSLKLQNELVAIQHKARKLTSTLVELALTIIGYYYWELFVRE